MDVLMIVANVTCWGTVVVVWIVGAVYNASHGARGAISGDAGPLSVIGAVAVAAIVVVTERGLRVVAQGLTLAVPPVRLLGLALLVASTGFALWARWSLGTSWSVAPQVRGSRLLRTRGPYAVTRHPIYTGLLGMLLGSALLAGLGHWIVLPVVGLLAFAAKIRMEEQLLRATFPDEYERYRREVPQLVPGFGLLRRRWHAAGGDRSASAPADHPKRS
jgi:protein-S-isoprenylcysteine O-methyltransferase Ste14